MTSGSKFEAELKALLTVEPRVTWEAEPPASRVTRGDVWTMRILVAGGLAALAAFLYWFLSSDRIGAPFLFWPMTAVFLYGFVLMLYEWFCYLGVRPRGPALPPGNRSVDILTTWVPGEPCDMVVSTLKAIQRIPYPHTTYLCDEGDDPLMEAVCEHLGVRHVTRVEKVGAKAGNINNALRRASGEIAVILDPDHEPAPFFLDRVLGYFDDPKVGFVQCVQGYYNQGESLIARGAAEQTYHFYGPVMTGMHGHGTTQAIGANCAFRRAALNSIHGHATGLAEDMATTLKLYAKGWTSVYVPETLTRGLVPNTFGAYASQQLKWACGVWDILIESLPAAWPTLGWKNRIHFVYNGLFYLRGFFVFLAILVPILALATGQMPWRITLLEFLAWFGPLLAAHLLIRQAAQRWVMEPSEYGFHIVGGFLMNATWWVNLAGASSAMRRVRIPYIPTPKDNEASDAWWLATPNLALAALSLAAAILGVWWDQSPFALLMGAFALTNALVLGFVSLGAQQKTVARLRNGLPRSAPERPLVPTALADQFFWLLRRQPLLFALPIAIASVVSLAGPTKENGSLQQLWAEIEGWTVKETGGFLLGLYDPAIDKAAYGLLPVGDALGKVEVTATTLGTDLSILSLYHWWGDRAIEAFPRAELDAIRASGAVPMITWGPSLADFAWAAEFDETAADRGIFRLITQGKMDYFIKAYAEAIRDYGGPVMIRFAHEMDNPQYPWSERGGNTPEEFVNAWRYVVEYFYGMGATNATWVWNPWKPTALDPYYPGSAYVDWVGLTLLNFGSQNGDGSWEDFETLYAPFEDWVKGHGKPVLLTEFGSTSLGGDRSVWLDDALARIAKRDEIDGLVFFNTDSDSNLPEDWQNVPGSMLLDWKINPSDPVLRSGLAAFTEARPLYRSAPPLPPPPKNGVNRVSSLGEGWQLMDGDDPFFIRGIVYGAGQGWRVPRDPTRRRVERDFEEIAAMGANTIRRYHPHWGDKNILRAANRSGLQVLAGFSLLKDVDYVNDAATLSEIEAEVLDWVRMRRDDPAILMWVIGNEVWGQMKHAYVRPFLTENRQAYMRFLNRLSIGIKALDPKRPVATAFEVSGELHGALADLDRYAPGMDVIGINAYFDAHFPRLQHAVHTFGGGRPWLLSEFGPDGYWDVGKTRWSNYGFPLEPSDAEKAQQYTDRWTKYVEQMRPFSLGGVAFAWSDRYEGSPTWFGLTDFQGRRKPSYDALREAWLGHTVEGPRGAVGMFAALGSETAGLGSTLTLETSAQVWFSDCNLEVSLIDADTYEVHDEKVLRCGDRKHRIQAPQKPGRYWTTVRAAGTEGPVWSTSLPLVVAGRGSDS